MNQLKNKHSFFDSLIIWRDKSRKKKILCCKKPISVWDANVNNIVIPKVVKTNSKYLIEQLDKVIRPLFLTLPKMSRYVKTFNVKNEDEYKNKK